MKLNWPVLAGVGAFGVVGYMAYQAYQSGRSSNSSSDTSGGVTPVYLTGGTDSGGGSITPISAGVATGATGGDTSSADAIARGQLQLAAQAQQYGYAETMRSLDVQRSLGLTGIGASLEAAALPAGYSGSLSYNIAPNASGGVSGSGIQASWDSSSSTVNPLTVAAFESQQSGKALTPGQTYQWLQTFGVQPPSSATGGFVKNSYVPAGASPKQTTNPAVAGKIVGGKYTPTNSEAAFAATFGQKTLSPANIG